eukprot:359167-Chlamydomonas_euryale.AAC.2
MPSQSQWPGATWSRSCHTLPLAPTRPQKAQLTCQVAQDIGGTRHAKYGGHGAEHRDGPYAEVRHNLSDVWESQGHGRRLVGGLRAFARSVGRRKDWSNSARHIRSSTGTVRSWNTSPDSKLMVGVDGWVLVEALPECQAG